MYVNFKGYTGFVDCCSWAKLQEYTAELYSITWIGNAKVHTYTTAQW